MPFLKLYRLMKEKGMSIDQVVNAVNIAVNRLPYMEILYEQVKDEVDKLQYTRQGLVNDIEARKHKILLLDKIAFSWEQDCKRTEQQIQELADKKDRIKKLIANILNEEGYSKLKQIVKKSVKAVLADNKQVISVAFTALFQTLKTDPQMAKLIQNIASTNDGEQHDDKNNNITQYIESNNDNILHLAEKHYENLVEALTNNAIATATSSSSPTLSLPQSSTFSCLSNRSDMDRIEEAEFYDSSKGDIAE